MTNGFNSELKTSREHNGTSQNNLGSFRNYGHVDLYERQLIDKACEAACKSIAPAWPLDRSIAVNPHWERIGLTVRKVAARMAVLGGIAVFPPRNLILDAWKSGRISKADLNYAFASLPPANTRGLTEIQCIEALTNQEPLPRLALLVDKLEDDPLLGAHLSWRQAITHQVSQTCAAYFDEHQAEWQPERSHGLYAFWRDMIMHDHGIGTLMGLPKLRNSLNALPASRADAESWVLERLGLPAEVWSDYLEALLLTVNGWASWCAYLRWQAALSERRDEHLRDLLAIRLAWGAILLNCKDDTAAHSAFAEVQREWQDAPKLLHQVEESLIIDEVWQLAYEAGFQRQLAGKLTAANQIASIFPITDDIEVQAAFCIDVRSEPLRRALESINPSVQTIGIAGFFGLPIAYTPLGTTARRPQSPGLINPSIEVSDSFVSATTQSSAYGEGLNNMVKKLRCMHFSLTNQAQSVSRWPGSSFSFVEAAGIGYLGKLAEGFKPFRRARNRDNLTGLPKHFKKICRPHFYGLDLGNKVDLALHVLRTMGIAHKLAPLVVLVGHGSQSINNAHEASLNCGACCGQTGEINTRLLAHLLNDPAVRVGLKTQGVSVPEETIFVAALHNTTTDEIEAFDIYHFSPDAQARWNRVHRLFEFACDQVRRERAVRLNIDPRIGNQKLLSLLRERGNDGAQTRPEWGLARNAAFIIASRHRSLGSMLDGRCFLHDYDASQDPDGSGLERLMTAPMLVTHWINWQYHASTSDPLHMGCGNKVLHNVVGGHIGVFEGNGGDLRIGLSKQSLHDGKSWIHEPLRLTVIIDSPKESIERIINKHETLGNLVRNGWLHLWQLGDSELLRFVDGGWKKLGLNLVN